MAERRLTAGRGKESYYNAKYMIPWARGLARRGLTMKEIAQELTVSQATLFNWMNDDPEFKEAIKQGKSLADACVEDSLYNRAMGMKVHETKTITTTDKNGVKHTRVEESDKELPPDVTACLFWLKNRRPNEWRDNPVIDVDEKTLEAVAKILGGVNSAIE